MVGKSPCSAASSSVVGVVLLAVSSQAAAANITRASSNLGAKIMGDSLVRFLSTFVLHAQQALVSESGCSAIWSTLLQLLAGLTEPTRGNIELPSGEITRAMLSIGLGFRDDLSGSENVLVSLEVQG